MRSYWRDEEMRRRGRERIREADLDPNWLTELLK